VRINGTSRLPDPPTSWEDAMTGERQVDTEVKAARGSSGIWTVGPRILVIADDPELGDWLFEEFQNRGCAVALATRRHEALDLVRSGLVDLVVAEMGFPEMPGMDLLRALQSMTNMPKRPKVILTATRQSEYLKSRVVANGASAVLCKPFRMEQLLALVATVLGD
jgi:DNA-binding response OmpR family regulator